MDKERKNQETELKLQVVLPEEWGKLCAFVKGMPDILTQERIALAANYFDTVTGDLYKAKMAYRVRRENQNWVATVKGGGLSDGGLHRRQEWNVPVQSGDADLSVFADSGRELGMLAQLARKELLAIVQTDFQRDIVLLWHQGGLIEVALDEGWIFASKKNLRILEVELELKEGNVAALFKLGALLAEKFALIVEEKSKFFRGLQLLDIADAKRDKSAGKNEGDRPLYVLLRMFYEKWINGIAIDPKMYLKKMEILQQEILVMPEIQRNLHRWMNCPKEDVFNREKLAVSALILLCAKIKMDNIS